MREEKLKKLIKEQRYIESIFKYGIITTLLLLDEYEKEGNFEECSIIKSAIEYLNLHTKESKDFEEMPTTYDSEAFLKLSEFSLYGFKKEKGPIDIVINMNKIIEEVKL